MASFVLEEFVGNGVLRDQMDSLTADGWSDVPTLKMMSKDDMDSLQLSQLQRDALELRTYLHDRHLMAYADVLEASGKNLSELLSTSPTELTAEYKMRRGHVARFLDRGSACGVQMPSNLVLPARQVTASHRKKSAGFTTPLVSDFESSVPSTPKVPRQFNHVDMSPHNSSFISRMGSVDGASRPTSFMAEPEYRSPMLLRPTSTGSAAGAGAEYRSPMLLRPTSTGSAAGAGAEEVMSKGIFCSPAAEPRCCGLVRPGGVRDEVTALSILEKIEVQKLAPPHSKGVNPFRGKGAITLPPPFKASDLWAQKPTLILCLRRPGCVMCRAEAHQLYTRKPIFDAMGIQMVVCLNEHIDAEVRSFWPRYWGGMVVVDEHRDFFKALGQGKLAKEGFVSGFLFNAAARANYKRATATGVEGNYTGEGTIKGGLYIIRPRHGGVAYQFVERNFGDWAPLDEVLQVCSDVMQRR